MTRITAEKIEKIAKKLRQLPPVQKKPEYSAEEAISLLKTEISAMKKRGYSLVQIAQTLRAEGLEIDTPSLKSYLQPAADPVPTRAPKALKKSAPPTAKPSEKKAVKKVTPLRTTRAAKSTRIRGAMFELKPDTEDI